MTDYKLTKEQRDEILFHLERHQIYQARIILNQLEKLES